jgi:uncharacterized OB-fold protein
VLPDTVRMDGDRPVLLGGRCRACGNTTFPKPNVCAQCWSEEIDSVELPARGKLYSYAIVHAARKGWAAPYTVAYVDLPDGVRVCAPLDCDVKNPPALDTDVELRVGPLRVEDDGTKIYSHRFGVIAGGVHA